MVITGLAVLASAMGVSFTGTTATATATVTAKAIYAEALDLAEGFEIALVQRDAARGKAKRLENALKVATEAGDLHKMYGERIRDQALNLAARAANETASRAVAEARVKDLKAERWLWAGGRCPCWHRSRGQHSCRCSIVFQMLAR